MIWSYLAAAYWLEARPEMFQRKKKILNVSNNFRKANNHLQIVQYCGRFKQGEVKQEEDVELIFLKYLTELYKN